MRISPKQRLTDLANAGKPLVEAGLALGEGSDVEIILRELNEADEELEASRSFYSQMSGKNDYLTIDATPEALERVFGWKIARVHLERWNPETESYEGVWENAYRWEELNKPTKYPSYLEGLVTEIGLTQPGTNDNGEAYP